MAQELTREQWDAKMLDLARIWITVVACRNCGAPRPRGFVCVFCNTDDTGMAPLEPRAATA